MDQPRSVVEKLSSAMVSDDLAVHEYRSDVDYIIALGAAGQGSGWAQSALARLRLGVDAGSLKSAIKAAIQVTRKMALKRSWLLGDGEIRMVAALAIRHFLTPVCPACHGRRYERIDGAPMLSDRRCQPCSGSGIKVIADITPRVTAARIMDVLGALQAMEAVLLDDVRKKLT